MKWPLLDYWWIAALALVIIILMGCTDASMAPKMVTPKVEFVVIKFPDGSEGKLAMSCVDGYKVIHYDRAIIYKLDELGKYERC